MSLKKINFKNILAGIVATVMAGTSIVGVARSYSVESPIFWKYDIKSPAEMAVYYNRERVTVDVALMLMGKNETRSLSETLEGRKFETVVPENAIRVGYDPRAYVAENTEEIKDEKKKNQEKSDFEVAQQAYVAHIEENPLFFNTGMILVDLDEDGIPELFSLEATKEEGISTFSFHPFIEGKVALPSLDAPFNNIDINLFANDSEEKEDNVFFTGVYRNKNTNKKALIICDLKSDKKVFDVIEYDGKDLKFDQIYEIRENDEVFNSENVEKFMSDYEYLEDELFVYVATDETKDKTTKAVFEELMAEFKK